MVRIGYPVILAAILAVGVAFPESMDRSLYWMEESLHNGRIVKIGLNESQPTTILDGLHLPGSVVVDGR